jgi:hypothetical protein
MIIIKRSNKVKLQVLILQLSVIITISVWYLRLDNKKCVSHDFISPSFLSSTGGSSSSSPSSLSTIGDKLTLLIMSPTYPALLDCANNDFSYSIA